MAPAAHDGFGLRQRLAHLGLRVGLDGQRVHDAGRVDETPQRGAGRRDDELVERQAEQVALFFDNADDAIGDVENLHFPAERVLAFEQLIGEVVAQDEDGGAGEDLLARERAALLDRERTNVEIQLRRGRDLDILGRSAAGRECPARVGFPRCQDRDAHAAHHRLRVLVTDAGAAHPGSPHRVGHVAELHVGELPQAKGVHAEQRARELVGHVAVHAFDDRHHGDEEHHADEDADDRKAALELLRPNGLKREANGVEK